MNTIENKMADCTESVCQNCGRPDCRYFQGGRSEAAYQDCIAHTAARADEALAAVKKAGRDPQWAAVYTWMDAHREQIYKDCFDANGRLECELAVARKFLKDAERDCKRALDEGADEHCARMEMAREVEQLRVVAGEIPSLRTERDQYKGEARRIIRVGKSFDQDKEYQLCACGWASPFDAEVCGNVAHAGNVAVEYLKTLSRLGQAEHDLGDPYRVKIAEEDRQMIFLALSRETILHPGFGFAIGLIADKFPGGREMLERFRQVEQPGVASVEK